ncbi:hypothetical protein JOB18_048158 [Solea senegalensis]|nr:hypothetical protein JOB18_048158 [Solea senegalensis]
MDVSVLVLCVLLSAVGCSAEKGARSNVKAASWTPWLVGLTAVVVFLFIVFTILIVRRLLKKKRPAVSWDYNRTSELDSHSQTKQTSM